MNFKRTCLYCGQPNDSVNYSCNCDKEGWTNQYRVVDIDMQLQHQRPMLTESFSSYSFSSPEGLLQYKGLPFHHILPEIGDVPGLTPLYELSHLSNYHGCGIFLKNEGDNPSGCFKDRETMLCLLNSKHNGLKKAVIYSSGNAAASAAWFLERSGLQLLTFVAGDTYPEKIDYIRKHGADVVVIGNKQTNFETGYRLFSVINEKKFFAQNGYDNWSVRNPYRVQGDKTISLEIIKQLSISEEEPEVPAYILVPTANGSCLVGIWKGFKELAQAGIIPRLPKMVSVGIRNANPVCKAVQQKETDKPVRCDLSKVDPRDREVGSIIVAEEGYDSMEAARAVIESEGFAVEVNALDIQSALADFLEREGRLALQCGILPEPASLTSLAAINQMKNRVSFSPSDILVSIATGDGLKAEHEITSLLTDRPALQDKVEEIVNKKKRNDRHKVLNKGRKINVEEDEEAIIRSFSQLQKQHA